MRKILFQEEDPKNLGILKMVLHPVQEEWETNLVPSAEAALNALSTAPWEAIVADLETKSGKGLLADARERFPDVVRIGLLGRARPPVGDLSLVHQFVSKPWELSELRTAVERSCRLRELLGDELICKTVGKLTDLPAVPSIYQKLTHILKDPDVSLQDVAKIVEGDFAISARILQLVNSSLFRTTREIGSVKTAASFLGLEVIKNLVLSMALFRAFEGVEKVPGFSLEDLQAHSRLTTEIVRALPLPRDMWDAAIVACLLHDVGKLVLAWKMPARFTKLLKRAREQARPLNQIEEELWGITHAEIGAYLLGLWGFPFAVTEAVAYHHAPSRVPHRCFDVLAAVYVSNLLAHECEAHLGVSGSLVAAHCDIDMAFLQELGVAEQLPAWRAIAQQQLASKAEAAAQR